MCLQTSGKPSDTKYYVEELLKFHNKFELLAKLQSWKVPRFPVDGNILKKHNCPSGRVMGVIINKLKEVWVKNEFQLTAEELIEHLPRVLEEMKIVDGKQTKKPKTQ